MMLQTQVFTLPETKGIVEQIDEMREQWYHVRDQQFYTLGRPAYQLFDRPTEYQLSNAVLNRLLWGTLESFYQRVFSRLEEFLNAPVVHVPRTALPGFHVFQYSDARPSVDGSTHFDLSYLMLLQCLEMASPAGMPEHLSYTCALELPDCSTGAELFPIRYDPACLTPYEELAATATPVFHPYRLGFLYLFDGHQLHRISLKRHRCADGRRITLQGHLFKLDNRWINYW